MKIAILGAGMQGTACAFDAAQNPRVEKVVLADLELEKAQAALSRVCSPKAFAQAVNVQDHGELVRFLEPFDVVVSAVPYFFNYQITQAAIAARTHMVDMGGNTDLVLKQRQLSEDAKAAGVTILPDAGVAPGLANILAVHGIEQMDQTQSVKIRVGGLPQNPKPPMNYQMFFSMHGLINEYVGQSVVLKDGKVSYVETLTDVETVQFREPIGTLEAFHTLGGISTLPWTYEGRIQTMDYKTMRYPGHCAQAKLLNDLGLLSEEPVTVEGGAVSPRDVFAAVVTPRLSFEDNRDRVLIRVVIEGEKVGEAVRLSYEIIDEYDEATGFTAMMRTTAFPVSILAQMMGGGEITARGVLPLETAVPTKAFLDALEQRNIRVWMDTMALEEAHAHG